MAWERVSIFPVTPAFVLLGNQFFIGCSMGRRNSGIFVRNLHFVSYIGELGGSDSVLLDTWVKWIYLFFTPPYWQKMDLDYT